MPSPRRHRKTAVIGGTLSPQQRGARTREERRRAQFRSEPSELPSFASDLRILSQDSAAPLVNNLDVIVDRATLQSLTAGMMAFLSDRLMDSGGAVDPSLADTLAFLASLIRAANGSRVMTLTFTDSLSVASA